MNRKTVVVILAVGMLALAGCGSNGGETASSSGNSSGGASISINQFSVTPATLKLNSKSDVKWSIAYSTPATGYTAEFHINNQPSLITGVSGLTRVFSANGDMGALTIGKDATISCSYGMSNSRPTLDCGTYGYRYIDNFDLTKPMYGILKACTYDSSMQQVCDQKSVSLTFSSTAAKTIVDDGISGNKELVPVSTELQQVNTPARFSEQTI